MTLSRRQFAQILAGGGLGAAFIALPKQRVVAQPTPHIVSTVEAFLNAIAPNQTIRLARGQFTLSDIEPTWRSPYAHFEAVNDGYELVIDNVENLQITGIDNIFSRLLTRPRYADVLKFRNCRNLHIGNLELAHTTDAGFCRGSVVAFANCENVHLDRCVLYGSGTHGIEANGLKQMRCRDSVIRDCTYGILCLTQADDVRFDGCHFFDNRGFSMISVAECQNINFADCWMYDNQVDLILGEPPIGNDYMFNVFESENITLNLCRLTHNQVTYLMSHPGAIAMLNTILQNNSFGPPDRLYPPDDDYQSTPFCPV